MSLKRTLPSRAAIVAAAACLAAAPLSAADRGQTLAAAMAARSAGQYEQAIALFEQLRAQTPDDPDLLRLLGTTYAFDRRYPEAIATLERAHELAPDDLDISLALVRAHSWSGENERALAMAQALSSQWPGNAEVGAVLATVTRAQQAGQDGPRAVTLGLAQGISRVTTRGGRRTWYDTAVSLAVRPSARTTLVGEITREDRSGTVDTHLALTGSLRIGTRGSAYLTLTGTPDADFREKTGVRGGGQWALAPVLDVVSDLRYGKYANGVEAFSASLGARLHDRADRYALTVRSITAWNDWDRQSPGWSARLDSAIGARTQVYLAGATYPDTEAGVTRRFRALYGGLSQALGDDVVVRAGLGWERRRSSYTRRAANVSVSIGF